jgi:hypothetical protein
LHVLKLEVALIVASTAAFFLERRRRQLAKDDEPSSVHPGALQERSEP